MKLVILLCFIALAVGAPPPSPNRGSNKYSPYNVQLLNEYFDNIGVGPYSYGFEQSDGSRREEEGYWVNQGSEDEYLAKRGLYSWNAPNGIRYTVKYVADTAGYQPEVEEGPGDYPPYIVGTMLGAG